MSKLEKLEEELYGKETEEKLAKRMRWRVVFPRTKPRFSLSWAGERHFPAPPLRRFVARLLFAGLLVIFVAGASFFIFLFLGTKGKEAELSVYGPSSAEAGELITIPLRLRNVSRVRLEEAELSFILPEGSILRRETGEEASAPPRFVKSLGNLEPGEEVAAEIAVRLFGAEFEEKSVSVSLLYRPENIRARFSVRAEKKVSISRVPLAVFWEAPDVLAQGQDFEFKVRFVSTASSPFANMFLRLEYPGGFVLSGAFPGPAAGENVWELGELSPGEDGFITVRGSILGEEGEIKSFRGGIGVFNVLTGEWKPYADYGKEIKIAVNPLSVIGFLNGERKKNVYPGERLRFTVRYKNNTPYTLKNVAVKSFLAVEPELPRGREFLEFNSLVAGSGGVFDFASRSVVWGPSGTPQLREVLPGVSGEFIFEINTKSRPVMLKAADKNITVVFRPAIESSETPEGLAGTKLSYEESLLFRVKSVSELSSRSLYRSAPVAGTGPLPPRVGQKTVYTILWEARNFTNDLEKTVVRAALPPNVKWEGNVYPSGENVSFDASSGEVSWKIGELKAGAGVITPVRSAAFQVSVIPSEADEGGYALLAGPAALKGEDFFVKEYVEAEADAVSTELREDPLTSFRDWGVLR